MQEYSSVVLLEDQTGTALKAGDIGILVHHHESGDFAEIEFMDAAGNTITVLTLQERAFRPTKPNEIPHVRATVEAAE